MNKKTIIGIGAGVAVLAVLGIYFLAVPAIQVASYKQVATTKHSELNEAVNKLGAILDSDTFVKSDVEAAKVHSDVKNGNEQIKNVEAKISGVKGDLTTFNSLPMLAFNNKYKTAQDLRADEAAYIDKTEAFLAEMKQVLAYFDKGADMTSKFADFSAAMEKAGQAQSTEEFASLLDKALQDVQPAVDAFSKVTPPASLKESHDYGIKATNELLGLSKQLAAAARAGDMDKMSTIADQITTKSDELKKKSDDYDTQFIRNSELRKLDDQLNQLDREIGLKQASL